MVIKIDASLKIELIEEKHAQVIFNLVNENREHLNTWLSWVNNMRGPDFIERFIEGSIQRHANQTEYSFVILENDILVGRIGLYKIDNDNKVAEIGYWLAQNRQGQGIIIRACKTLINFAFNNLFINRLEIKCGTHNIKSKKIPQQLNFIKEGIARQAELVNNNYIDLDIYSLLRNDRV